MVKTASYVIPAEASAGVIYGGGTNKNYINGYRNHRSHAIALPTAGMTWFQ